MSAKVPNEPQTGHARGFVRITLGLGAALLLGTSGLATVNLWQSPRVTAVQEQPAQLVEAVGGRISLSLSQAVRSVNASDVTLTPAVPYAVESFGPTVIVTLQERLNPATTLHIDVRVTGAATGVEAALEHDVQLPDTRVYTLVQGSGGATDSIVGNDLVGGGAPAELRTQRRVTELAVLPGRALAVLDVQGAKGGAAGGVALGEFQLPGGDYREVIPASLGQLTQLRTESTGLFAGVVATGVGLTAFNEPHQLLLFDGRSGLAAPQPVLRSDGRPFEVADWRFVAGGVGVVVMTTSGELWLATPGLGRRPMRLGEADRLVGIDPDSGELIATRGDSVTAHDIAARVLGKTGAAPRELAHLPVGIPADQTGAAAPAPVAVGLLAGAALVLSDGATLSVFDAGAIRPLYEPAGEGSRIGAVCVSPSGSMLAVEVISKEGEPTGRETRGNRIAYSRTSTIYLHAGSGDVIRSSIGVSPDWC